MICETNLMPQSWFINQPLAQHVSGTIMPIFTSARPYTTVYGYPVTRNIKFKMKLLKVSVCSQDRQYTHTIYRQLTDKIYRQYRDNIQTIYTHNIQTTYRQYTHTMYRQYTDNLQTIYRQYTHNIQTIYRQLTDNIHTQYTDNIPTPINKFYPFWFQIFR